MDRPNVLCVVLDTARADAVEPFGAPAGATPAIAQLANRGTAHHATHASASWTVPSHASMFTGVLPRELGLTQIPGGVPQGSQAPLEAHRHRLLPEVLRRHGYATAAISTNLWLRESSGFALGFDRFASISPNRQAALDRGGLAGRARWTLEGVRATADDGAAEAGRVLCGWAEETAGEAERTPFFWFVNLVECHSPYLPPREHNPLGLRDRARAAEEARRHLTLDAIWRTCAGAPLPAQEVLDRMRRLYAGAVRYMDDWLADALEALDARGLLDDTLVIVTSDHGENFGENGLVGHAFSLDDRLVRVPLVSAGPVELPLEGPASLTDLPRALGEALALDGHPWQDERRPFPVAQFDPPTGREDERVDAAIAQWGLGEEAAWRITTPITAVSDGRVKLVRQGDVERVHDLEADPLEARPLSDPPPELHDRVAALRTALDDPAVWATAAPPRPKDQPKGDEAEELERQMRLLGYL